MSYTIHAKAPRELKGGKIANSKCRLKLVKVL